eukprot:TRINITY_DN2119_c0_g1_i1.p1 TRINITY_DN2119_c0_g1~~TRINITY_DN2119_c0_g1_i1.p1  ORF type:complete len:291 (-),score=63.03 TRINITY_DN2119_c0_g1_i1:14-886(-)
MKRKGHNHHSIKAINIVPLIYTIFDLFYHKKPVVHPTWQNCTSEEFHTHLRDFCPFLLFFPFAGRFSFSSSDLKLTMEKYFLLPLDLASHLSFKNISTEPESFFSSVLEQILPKFVPQFHAAPFGHFQRYKFVEESEEENFSRQDTNYIAFRTALKNLRKAKYQRLLYSFFTDPADKELLQMFKKVSLTKRVQFQLLSEFESWWFDSKVVHNISQSPSVLSALKCFGACIKAITSLKPRPVLRPTQPWRTTPQPTTGPRQLEINNEEIEDDNLLNLDDFDLNVELSDPSL